MRPTDANRPLRILEKALHGGPGKGNLGAVMARHGTGKVAVLTSISVDHAMDGRNTLHVAVGQSVSDVRAYDDEVLHQICERYDLRDRASILTTVERHKQIYTFRRRSDFTAARLRQVLDFLGERAEFRPEMLEVQGWPDWAELDEGELQALRSIAADYDCEIWVTVHTRREDELDPRGIPSWLARFEPQLAVILALEPEGEHVRIRPLKVPDGAPAGSVHLEFDPTTMLVRWR